MSLNPVTASSPAIINEEVRSKAIHGALPVLSSTNLIYKYTTANTIDDFESNFKLISEKITALWNSTCENCGEHLFGCETFQKSMKEIILNCFFHEHELVGKAQAYVKEHDPYNAFYHVYSDLEAQILDKNKLANSPAFLKMRKGRVLNLQVEPAFPLSPLRDIERVGPNKPLGYLPKSILDKTLSEANQKAFLDHLTKKGLVILTVLKNNDEPFHYVYDPKALHALLNSPENKKILHAIGNPLLNDEVIDPAKYVQFISTTMVRSPQEARDLIAESFGVHASFKRVKRVMTGDRLNLARLLPRSTVFLK